MILYSLCSLYLIMDVIKDVEEVGLNHEAIRHGWYYIVYVVEFIFNNGCYQGCWRTRNNRIKPWSNLYMNDTIYVYVVNLYSIMDVIKDVEEVGLPWTMEQLYMDDQGWWRTI